MPMGVASMSFTRWMPGASTAVTCAGSGCPAMTASRPGTRLSRIRVVLPEPDTPVTTVSRPLGMVTARGFTVWIAPVVQVEWSPPANSSSFGAGGAHLDLGSPGEERPDLGGRVAGHRLRGPLGDHLAALGAGLRPHLDEPVRLFQNLGVVVHQQHRVPVGHQVLHHPA